MSLLTQSNPLYNTLEVVKVGSTTLVSPNSAGNSTNVSVTHGLDFKPIVLAFVAFSSTGTRYPLPYLSVNLTANLGEIDYQVSYEIVDSIITFYHRDLQNASNVTDYIKYYLLRDPVQ